MPSSSGSTLPLAIVIAGGLVGLGLYMGLRSSAPQALPPAVADPPSAPKPPKIEPGEVAATPAVSAEKTGEDLSALKQTVERQALAAIEAKRDEIVTKCWNPSAEKNPEPAKVEVGVSLSFRATGVVVASGMIESREAARPDIMSCVGAIAHAIEIPPPGQNVSVEVYFDLP